jgi:hypothetical protein
VIPDGEAVDPIATTNSVIVPVGVMRPDVAAIR